ncbi:MAG: transporter substrate-binding domain-containing protein [Tissierellia bacterium]|nr:transporter substrate-binding domain-containing protein [Tissierellia bacterium]MDD4726029.1 transporter substrate-binding domain-containing protein [Tissierellia bacterium]
MSKKVLLILLAVSMLFVFGACSQSEKPAETPAEAPAETPAEEPAEEGGKLAEIKDKGKIVLATAADYPPYEFHKLIDGKDEIVGFDIEIAKAIADELGVELEIVDMKFEGLIAALVTDDVDMVIAGMEATEERAETVDFSIPYYQANQRMVIRAENQDEYIEPKDLAGKPVGAQKATTQERFVFEQYPDSEFVGLSKITDLVLELQNKKIDAVVLAEPVAKSYVEQNADLYLAEIDLGKEDPASIAFNKGNEDLIEEINPILEKLINDGTVDRLMSEATVLADQE